MKFNKDTVIGTVLEKHKDAEAILTAFGMHCLYCPCSQAETLEEACAVHGINVDAVVDKLNEKPVKKATSKSTKSTSKSTEKAEKKTSKASIKKSAK